MRTHLGKNFCVDFPNIPLGLISFILAKTEGSRLWELLLKDIDIKVSQPVYKNKKHNHVSCFKNIEAEWQVANSQGQRSAPICASLKICHIESYMGPMTEQDIWKRRSGHRSTGCGRKHVLLHF